MNNAGGSPGADSATASPRFFAAVTAINLTGVLVFSQKANAVMQQQDDGGTIINISSVAGIAGAAFSVAYGASKAGVINATKSLAVEWGPKVRVNCIAPGLIMTEGADYLAPTEEAKTSDRAGDPGATDRRSGRHRRCRPFPGLACVPLHQRRDDRRRRRTELTDGRRLAQPAVSLTRPRTPTGRGRALKMLQVWVRVPPGARASTA